MGTGTATIRPLFQCYPRTCQMCVCGSPPAFSNSTAGVMGVKEISPTLSHAWWVFAGARGSYAEKRMKMGSCGDGVYGWMVMLESEWSVRPRQERRIRRDAARERLAEGWKRVERLGVSNRCVGSLCFQLSKTKSQRDQPWNDKERRNGTHECLVAHP